ncbi:hypothetical protein QQP08_001050 [Theobroma cacao]|nr:hypothetical protein QQP08_001050 [Theobroma cacao]
MAASKAFAAVLVIAMLSAMASAQDFGAAPAPSPSMDKGAAYSLGMSGAAICSSLLLSALALLRQPAGAEGIGFMDHGVVVMKYSSHEQLRCR